MQYLSINQEYITEIVVDKSRFISYLSPCKNKDEANNYIDKIRLLHPDATHVCSAYILLEKNQQLLKYDDDGEPSATAGAPILNVLKKNNLDNIICVVVRYFGGIKLGAGGLVRTYGKSCTEVLKIAKIVRYQSCPLYKIVFSYKDIKLIEQIINSINGKIINKKFLLEVEFIVILKEEKDMNIIYKKLEGEVKYQYLKKDYIEI